MFDAFLVAWRESAEALLIIAMLRECLLNSGWGDDLGLIKRAVGLAVVWFCACAAAIVGFASEPVFDALLTIATSIGVALMAMGMAVSAAGIRRRMSDYMHRWAERPNAPLLVMGLVALLILREGLEMLILLRAIAASEGLGTMLTGAFLGVVAAALTTRIWVWARSRFGLLMVFRISAVLLLLLAAKLAVQGCLELLQTRCLPIDHDYWLALVSPLLADGPGVHWAHVALLCPPLFYFLRTWWREADAVDVARKKDGSPLN